MIIALEQSEIDTSDPRAIAGAAAEKQMAFYLHRAFGAEESVHVLNGLRLVDPQQPGPDGAPGVCQIDHLVLHRFGVFIIESKSATDQVTVRGDGSGGDEWTRRFRGREQGFASPLQQARRQGEFLRTALDRHCRSMLGKAPTGFRTLAKVVKGTDQRGFTNMPIQLVIAISDGGKIVRIDGWEPQTKPFRDYVCKADVAPQKIREELAQHRKGLNPLAKETGQYGLWAMKAEEVEITATFLASLHSPRKITAQAAPAPARSTHVEATPAPPSTPVRDVVLRHDHAVPAGPVGADKPVCKSCGGGDLTARSGKYGYYWACNACNTNTRMPTVCGVCGAEGRGGQTVRIRKDGPVYLRSCGACGIEERVWTERSG